MYRRGEERLGRLVGQVEAGCYASVEQHMSPLTIGIY